MDGICWQPSFPEDIINTEIINHTYIKPGHFIKKKRKNNSRIWWIIKLGEGNKGCVKVL
jgi:hypothetical protein